MFLKKRSILIMLFISIWLSGCIAVPMDMPKKQPNHSAYKAANPPTPAYRNVDVVLRTVDPVAERQKKANMGYAIQLIATKDRPKANTLRNQYASSGYRAFVNHNAVNQNGFYRVQIGPYPTRAEADNVLIQLRSHYPADSLAGRAYVHKLRR